MGVILGVLSVSMEALLCFGERLVRTVTGIHRCLMLKIKLHAQQQLLFCKQTVAAQGCNAPQPTRMGARHAGGRRALDAHQGVQARCGVA